MKLPRRHGLTIEKYALLTENAPELGAELDEWHGFYRGASPGERTLLDMAVMASVHLRRILACLTETANQQVRTAIFHFDCEQEDEIQRFRDMLESRPGVAVVGLKRSALGCRFLILRWERLLRLLESDGTLYGKDRDEAIHYQGARATDPANLFESEGAYLTWIYCLMAQPDPRDEDFVEIGNKSWMPMGLNDRKIHHWLGDDALSRKLLKEIAERELAALRPREERLRKNYEEPARWRRDPQAVHPGPGGGPAGARDGPPRSPVPPRLWCLPEGAQPEREDRPGAGWTQPGAARHGRRFHDGRSGEAGAGTAVDVGRRGCR